MLNQFQFGYTRLNALNTIPVSAPEFDEFGINGIGAPTSVIGISQFSFATLPDLGDEGGYPNQKLPQTYEAKDNVTMIRGNHSLKAGIDYRYQRAYQFTSGGSRGKFKFDGSFTQDPQNRSGTGSDFADFLLGVPQAANLGGGQSGDTLDPYWGAYFQDDWKVKPNLTVNMGIRYEYFANITEINNQQANFLFGPDQLIFPDNIVPDGIPADLATTIPDGLGSRTLMKPDLNNFSPRLGIAWQFAPKTVVRAGAGIYYSEGIDTYIGGANMLLSNPPFTISYAYKSDKLIPTLFVDQGFPADAHDPASIGASTSFQAYDPNLPRPYVADFTLDIQQQLPSQILLDVGYSGSKGTQLPVQLDANQELPGPGSVNSREPIPAYGTIQTVQSMDNSNYNSLVVSVKRRFSHALGFMLSYTYGKAISSAEDKFADSSVRSDHNLDWERSLTDFDVRNRFVGSFLWQLPYGAGQRWNSGSKLVNGVLGGWQINGIVTLQSGLPFTPSLNSNTANTSGAARPDRLANGNLPADQRGPSDWFDLSAFAPADASAYQYGNVGQNILIGPGIANCDLSLFKSAHIAALGEGGRIEFRFEAFNALNTPQFGLPAATVDLPGAGTITSLSNPMRELQFGMKLLF
jgi:TonB dependent receptor-like, beta-barrel